MIHLKCLTSNGLKITYLPPPKNIKVQYCTYSRHTYCICTVLLLYLQSNLIWIFTMTILPIFMFVKINILYNEVFFFWWLLGLFPPPGHIDTLFPVRALNPEPRTRPYEIRISVPDFSLQTRCESIFTPLLSLSLLF